MNTDLRHWWRSNAFVNVLRTKLFILFILVFTAFMSGCGQSTSDSGVAQHDSGELIIGLTDAEGDFVTYTVDVESITLTKANGTIVHVLPLTTRVDFAQYTELTEFLTASMVPLGAYTAATMVLDYTNADIRVENANGDAVMVSSIEDSDGNTITELEMTVHLEGRNRLVISRGLPGHLTLDFDLNATNKAVFDDVGIPALIVEPYLVADAYLHRPKEHRVRGLLNDVDVDNSQFEIIINPFHQSHTTDSEFGTLTVMTDDETVYDINNQSYEGLPGLQAMGDLAQYTAAIAIGKYKFNPTRFVAKEVYAGESVPGGTMDVVKGNVIARSENVLTVKGATLIRSGGTVIFNDEVLVYISDTTMVKKQLSTEEHTIDEISVGQKVSIFGTITNGDNENMEMDATNGVVRMKVTKVYGASVDLTVTPLESNYFVMDAKRFNGRPVSLFDFSGTGIDAEHDADPAFYEVDTDMLPVDDVVITPIDDVVEITPVDEIIEATPIKVFGFVAPFGSAPADFTATTLVDLTKVPATLTMNWTPHTDHPFSEVTENSVTLNLMDRGVFHHVGRGGAIVDLSTISPPPVIRGMASGGRYELKEKGPRQVFTDFSSLIEEIEARMSSGSSMKRIVAHGYFNDLTGTLTADKIHVKLK